MTVRSDNLIWNKKKQRWEDKDGNVGYDHKRVCEKCNKPRLDINGVIDCDFCLQGLTDNIDEQQSTRICVWFEDLLNDVYEDNGD